MRERLITFAGVTAIFSGAFTFVFAIGWALLSFASWQLMGPPPLELVRFLFGVCVLVGLICALAESSDD